jgi:hypothetical protein
VGRGAKLLHWRGLVGGEFKRECALIEYSAEGAFYPLIPGAHVAGDNVAEPFDALACAEALITNASMPDVLRDGIFGPLTLAAEEWFYLVDYGYAY